MRISRSLALFGALLCLSSPRVNGERFERTLEHGHYALEFRDAHVAVHDRRDPAATVGFELESIVAADGRSIGLGEPTFTVIGREVAIDRQNVRTIYAIGASVVEQAFAIAAPPSRRRGDVTIGLRIDGLAARLDDVGGIAFVDRTHTARLHYGQLVVRDRTGRALPSRITADGAHLAIHFDDRGAEYPVLVDPSVWGITADIVPPGGVASERFGSAAAADGSVLVVGAGQHSGSAGANQGTAYVFRRDAAGWTLLHQLAPNTARASAQFGSAVDVDVDMVSSRIRVVVGAKGDSNGTTTTGMAYVFESMNFGAFVQLAAFAPSLAGITTSANFGASVAIDGDLVVVGAPDYGASSQGGAEIFAKPGVGPFASTTTITQPAPQASDRFGSAVAIAGTTIVVGATGVDLASPPTTDFGAAFVFTTTDQLSWTPTSTVPSAVTSPTPFAKFGASLAFDGSALLVGAPFFNNGASTGAGRVYVFDAPSYVGRAELDAPIPGTAANLGASIALDGMLYVAGSPGDPTFFSEGGAAVVYRRTGDTIAAGEAIRYASSGASGEKLGTSVAVARLTSSSEVLIGAPQRSAGAVAGTGTVAVANFGLGLGETCSVNSECALGFCVDGVCCENGCDGGSTSDCKACSTTAGSLQNGLCQMRDIPACVAGPDGLAADPRVASCATVTRSTQGGMGPLICVVLLFGVLRRRASRQVRRAASVEA